ncbi:MAG: FAD-dependent oxidoreductase [Deltaproteobacteria bacterium]|nr:FAD-dependent oxidoreductase [Deltaproteobacteria bacterium]
MPQNIVIIGAVALGPKAACRFKRLEPESSVTMVDQGTLISYGGCGIPYYISGDVNDPGQLQATSFNMLRDDKFFRNAKDIRVMTGTRAVAIDRRTKEVHIIDLASREEGILPYDKLVLATGSIPRSLPVTGSDLEGTFTISNLDNAIAVREMIAGGEVEKALVIGSGAVGLEMAEAISDLWGIETTVVEIADQILPGVVSQNMARMAQHHIEENGITFYLSEKVEQIEGEKRVERVITDKRVIEADLVIMAVGVEPNSELAREAGLKLSSSGGIVVNRMLQSSDPDIYSGGDCVEITNLITGRPGYYPLGSIANRQGRVIGSNLAGGTAEFAGAVGSFVIKLFDTSIASAGLNIEAARREGFDAISAFIVQFDRSHFYPEKDLISLELVVERQTRRVLGIQGFGNKGEGTVRRIDAVAAILKYRPTTEDISNLEIAYSPPFSAAMDILNALGNTAENILEGKNRVMDVDEFSELWQERKNDGLFFLDCRGHSNAKPFVERYPFLWYNIPQDELRTRIDEIPGDKRILLICNTGVRSYEAQVTLDQMGITDSVNIQGGMAGLKQWGLDI